MSRKALPHTTAVGDVDLPEEALRSSQNAHAAADIMVMDSTDALLKAGRIQGMEFLQHVTDVAIAQTFTSLKESRGYKGLPYRDKDGNLQHVTDLEEFCRAFFGKAYSRCQQLAQNLQLLGSELYEHAEQIGFRARDYQALKALPADEQAIIRQAIESSDREQVIELMQEMALKYVREKDDLTKRSENAEADKDAVHEVLGKEKNAHQQTKIDLEKAKRRIQTLSADEAAKELRQEVIGIAFEAEADISGKLREAFATLAVHAEETGTDHRNFQSGLVNQLERLLADIRAEFQLPDSAGSDDLDFFNRQEH